MVQFYLTAVEGKHSLVVYASLAQLGLRNQEFKHLERQSENNRSENQGHPYANNSKGNLRQRMMSNIMQPRDLGGHFDGHKATKGLDTSLIMSSALNSSNSSCEILKSSGLSGLRKSRVAQMPSEHP